MRFVWWIVGGALAYWLVRRLMGGTPTEEHWSLYREIGRGGVDDALFTTLTEKLRGRGYSPMMDHDGGLATIRQSGRDGQLRLDLRELDVKGYATLEVRDAGDRLCTELASYALYELGLLLPGLTIRPTFAAATLTAESTDTLLPLLPDRPLYL